MNESRCVLASFLLVSLFFGPLRADQAKGTEISRAESAGRSMELTTVGEVRLSTGHRAALRVYTAPDDVQGTLTYARFHSPADAKRQIADWLKLTNRTMSKERTKDERGRVTGDRIVAITRNTKSGKKEFLVIRRETVNCYLIESPTLAVALQVEELTKDVIP